MATRFYSPWSRATSGFREALMQIANDRRLDAEEKRRDEDLKLRQEQERRMAEQAAAEQETRRIANERAAIANAEAAGRRVGVGGVLSGAEGEAVRKVLPSMVDIEGGQMSLPAHTLPVTLAPLGGEGPTMEGKDLGSTMVDETVKWKGTPQERALERIKQNVKIPEEIRDLIEAGVIDDTALARLLVPSKADEPKVGSFEDYVVRKYGKNPTAEQIAKAREEYRLDERAGSGGGQPYSIPVTTNYGIVSFNTRAASGQSPWDFSGVQPKSLPAAAQQSLAAYNASQTVLGTIENQYKPEYSGFFEGRVREKAAEVFGEGVVAPKGSAEFYANLQALKNQMIKAITGAQMSEPEARRIMSQLPTAGISDDAFKARMKTTTENLQTIRDEIYSVGTGIKFNPNAVSEQQLQQWYPERGSTTGGTTPSSSASPGEWEEKIIDGVKVRRRRVQ